MARDRIWECKVNDIRPHESDSLRMASLPYPLSSIDNTLIEVQIAVVWGYANDELSKPGPFAAFCERLREAMHLTVDKHFPLLKHPLTHSGEIGYFLERARLLPPLFQVCEAPEHPAPHPPREDGRAWEPPAVAHKPHDPEAEALGGRYLRCFTLRVTRLNGGIAVLGLLNHVVGDAASLVSLMKAISQVVEGGAEAATMRVVEDRALLRGAPAPSEGTVPPPIICAQETAQHDAVAAVRSMGEGERGQHKPVRRRFTRAEVEAMKHEVESEDYAPTSNDVLVAYTMSVVAGQLAPDTPLGGLFPANLRTGRYPGLTDEYFGNAVITCVTPLWTAGAMASMPLAELAHAVHRAKWEWTATARVDEMLLWEAARPSKSRACYSLPWAALGITNWTSFPFFDVALGIGVPTAVTPAYPGWIDLLGFILPTEPAADGAVDVVYTLPPPAPQG